MQSILSCLHCCCYDYYHTTCTIILIKSNAFISAVEILYKNGSLICASLPQELTLQKGQNKNPTKEGR